MVASLAAQLTCCSITCIPLPHNHQSLTRTPSLLLVSLLHHATFQKEIVNISNYTTNSCFSIWINGCDKEHFWNINLKTYMLENFVFRLRIWVTNLASVCTLLPWRPHSDVLWWVWNWRNDLHEGSVLDDWNFFCLLAKPCLIYVTILNFVLLFCRHCLMRPMNFYLYSTRHQANFTGRLSPLMTGVMDHH